MPKTCALCQTLVDHAQKPAELIVKWKGKEMEFTANLNVQPEAYFCSQEHFMFYVSGLLLSGGTVKEKYRIPKKELIEKITGR